MNELGKSAYSNYIEAMGGNYPPWEHLSVREMAAWEVVAREQYIEPEPVFEDDPTCNECDGELTCAKCNAPVPVNSGSPDSK